MTTETKVESTVPMVLQDQAIAPTTFDSLMRQAEVLFKSGFCPVALKTPEAVVAVILTGRELGIGPMLALRSIYMQNGKPCLMANLIAALIRRDGHAYSADMLTDTECKITFTRKGGQVYSHAFTLADAQKAELTGGSNAHSWKHYPKAMLFSRCISAGARIIVPEVIAGLYTAEELDVPVTVTEDGEMTVETTTDGPKPAAWTTDQKALAALWKWARDNTLTNANVHEALGVESVKDFTGTMAEAKAQIEAWITAQTTSPALRTPEQQAQYEKDQESLFGSEANA